MLDQQRRLWLTRWASLGLTGIHCLLLLGVMMATSHVLVSELLRDVPQPTVEMSVADRACWSWSTLGWFAVTFVWLVVFLYAFLMI